MPDAPPAAHNLLLILAKDLGSRLATPVFVVDRDGRLLYFNEAAEAVLGLPYAEAGELTNDDLAELFRPRGDDGNPVPLRELPIGAVLAKREPAHRVMTIQAGDGVQRRIAVTALPLFAHADEFVGVLSLFWPED